MPITSFTEVEAALQPYINYNSGLYTVDMTKQLATFVGNPEARLKVVHVAGTSGKTSTCYYTRELLQMARQKTGLTVSPHIVNIADRVQVNGVPLAEEDFCRYFDEFYEKIQRFEGQPSYFEVMMVFALWVFDREGVDYAVIETGLGGLHDSSNICRRADKLCVLTDIGLDHTAVLGDSMAEIAAQKLGIVAPGNQLIMHQQPAEVMRVVEKVAPAVIVVEAPVTDDYRQRNCNLAYETYRLLATRDGLPTLPESSLGRCATVQVPGRLDCFTQNGTTIVLDGAHNGQKMTALVATFTKQFPGAKPVVVLAMKQGKEPEEVIRILAPLVDRIVATEYQTFQDTRLGAIAAHELASEAEKVKVSVCVERDIHTVLDKATEQADMVLVTGSLYAVSEIRQLLV